MSAARDAILGRLRAAPARPAPPLPDWTPPRYGDGRAARFRAMLESFRAEVVETSEGAWPAVLREKLTEMGATTLLHAPATPESARLATAWGESGPRLIAYDRPVEELKPILVHEADASLTTARAGIAQTGSVVLWPDGDQPRLMSLLPPIHAVLVRESTLADSLADLMDVQGWTKGLPTNALLISGPSKTADIEQTLAYGVHGPKALLVLLIKDDDA